MQMSSICPPMSNGFHISQNNFYSISAALTAEGKLRIDNHEC